MIRTDLALEAKEMYHENAGKVTEIDGVRATVEEHDGLIITTVQILNENGKRALNKEAGTYITIEMPDFTKCAPCYTEVASNELKNQLLKLLPVKKGETVLVAGLGNRSITSDALGSFVFDRLIITRHLHDLAPESVKDFGNVCGIAPGVLGNTGMETAEIIKSVTDRIKPSAVIVTDALAARSADRIGTTIQLSDTGLSPGSGIGNRRSELSEKSLGVPVISVGVPTVIDASTLAFDIISKASASPFTKKSFEHIKSEIFKSKNSMIVTPKEADSLLRQISDITAFGINMALHGIPLSDIPYYTA